MSEEKDQATTTPVTTSETPNETPEVTSEAAVADAFAVAMSQNWESVSGTLPAVDGVARYTSDRRARLAQSFPGETLVVPTGPFKVRANDTDYPFRAGTDFFWLTGCHEPDAVLVIAVSSSGDATSTLFLADRSDRSSPAFYRDRRYGELWVGPRNGVAETQAMLGVDCRPLPELPSVLEALDPASTRVLRTFDASVDAVIPVAADDDARDAELAARLSELRLVKDDYEIERLREATAATAVGFEECVKELRRASSFHHGERWLEGTFWRRARVDGNDVGYGSIVACGHHATTLHWVHNDGPVRNGDLALLDMGIESRSLYTADITRAFPINGRFSPVQRRVYEAVYDAYQEALCALKPGAAFLDPHNAAMRVLAGALEDWGLLPGTADESMQPGAGFHRRYTLHGVSHMLGLDVHDCANARDEHYYKGALQEGMVLTIEPGLYFQRDDLTVPDELRGIGVRIEDDVLVTADGFDVLSHHLPTQADEVEQWMARLTTG